MDLALGRFNFFLAWRKVAKNFCDVLGLFASVSDPSA
jgi:hypothetical protein